MEIKYAEIAKFFKTFFASHYDDLVLYFYVFWGQKLGLEISRVRKKDLFTKFKCGKQLSNSFFPLCCQKEIKAMKNRRFLKWVMKGQH